MLRLGLPKRTGRRYFRDDLSGPGSRGIDVSDGVFRGPLLLIGGIEDRGAIAGSEVVTLPIRGGWIMNLEEELQQLAIALLLGVKDSMASA